MAALLHGVILGSSPEKLHILDVYSSHAELIETTRLNGVNGGTLSTNDSLMNGVRHLPPPVDDISGLGAETRC